MGTNIRQVRLEDENGNLINSTYPLAVREYSFVSSDNSYATPLAIDGIFTGTWEDILQFSVIIITLKADVASATDGLCVEWSNDGITTLANDYFTLPANKGKTYTFQPVARYFRIVYTNGGTIQTSFVLHTQLKSDYVKPSSHRIQDNIIDEDDAELVKSVLTGISDINGIFENVLTYRGALQVDSALVHKVGINEHAKRDLGASTTLDVAASSGDTTINVADTTGFGEGDIIRIYDSTVLERGHFHITAVSAGVSLTLDRPLDNAFEIGDNVQEIEIEMNKTGTLAAPVSYKIQPATSERYQITRILITMLDGTSMDDGKFGGLTALTNGVVLRVSENSVVRTLTIWKSNSDLKDDMFDVTYSDKAPSGQFGFAARWTFTKAEFVVDLDGANGDYLEVLIQDSLTGLDNFEIKAQGRLFGG